jgi:hypothetical protein
VGESISSITADGESTFLSKQGLQELQDWNIEPI